MSLVFPSGNRHFRRCSDAKKRWFSCGFSLFPNALMAASPSSTTTAIAWSIQTLALGNLSFPIARLSFQLYGRTTLPGRRVISCDCWLDTGAPLTVIPFHVHNQRLLWQPLPGLTTTWMGQRCDVGRVDLWL